MIIPEQFACDLMHVQEVVKVSSDPTQNTEYQLYEEGWLDQLAIYEIGQIIKMPKIITFKLETSTVPLTEFP